MVIKTVPPTVPVSHQDTLALFNNTTLLLIKHMEKSYMLPYTGAVISETLKKVSVFTTFAQS